MPFSVHALKNGKWGIKKIKDDKFVKSQFNTKESAISQAKNFMKYRGEKPIVKGNKILSKKKK